MTDGVFLEEIEFKNDFPPFKKGTKVKFGDGIKEVLEFYLRKKESWSKSDAEKVAERMKINVIVGENGMGKSRLFKGILDIENNYASQFYTRENGTEGEYDIWSSENEYLKITYSNINNTLIENEKKFITLLDDFSNSIVCNRETIYSELFSKGYDIGLFSILKDLLEYKVYTDTLIKWLDLNIGDIDVFIQPIRIKENIDYQKLNLTDISSILLTLSKDTNSEDNTFMIIFLINRLIKLLCLKDSIRYTLNFENIAGTTEEILKILKDINIKPEEKKHIVQNLFNLLFCYLLGEIPKQDILEDNLKILEQFNIILKLFNNFFDDLEYTDKFKNILSKIENIDKIYKRYEKAKIMKEIDEDAEIFYGSSHHDRDINNYNNLINTINDSVEKINRTIKENTLKKVKEEKYKITGDYLNFSNYILNNKNNNRLMTLLNESLSLDLLIGGGNKFLSVNYLSAGQKVMLFRISTLYKKIIDSGKKSFLILIDEPDLHLHLDWQRQYIQKLIDVFAEFLKDNKDIRLHFIITTHSPFILSDVPAENIVLLQKGDDGKTVVTDWKEKKGTFGANFVDLIRNGFFFDTKNLMGSFAEEVIDKIAQIEKDEIIKNKEVKDLSKIKKNIKEKIGDSFLKDNLLYFKKSDAENPSKK